MIYDYFGFATAVLSFWAWLIGISHSCCFLAKGFLVPLKPWLLDPSSSRRPVYDFPAAHVLVRHDHQDRNLLQAAGGQLTMGRFMKQIRDWRTPMLILVACFTTTIRDSYRRISLNLLNLQSSVALVIQVTSSFRILFCWEPYTELETINPLDYGTAVQLEELGDQWGIFHGQIRFLVVAFSLGKKDLSCDSSRHINVHTEAINFVRMNEIWDLSVWISQKLHVFHFFAFVFRCF